MADNYLTLRITLSDTYPEVWRDVVVLDSVTFHTLHKVIQLAMGWTDSHLYNFYIDKETLITIPDDDHGYFSNMDVLDASRQRLKNHISRLRKKFRYEYDLGDSWNHTIQVLKVVPIVADPLGGIVTDTNQSTNQIHIKVSFISLNLPLFLTF
jgi:hypothetical protein